MRSSQPLRPLPRTVRPVHRETIDSYLARLAAANRIPPQGLLRHLQATPSHRDQALPQRLATASGYPEQSLIGALPELQYLRADRVDPRIYFPRQRNHYGVAHPACQPCMAARGITTPVHIFVGEHQRVCVRHRRWLDQRQFDLTTTPEIVHAHQRRRRLARRHRSRMLVAYADAHHIVQRWLRTPYHLRVLHQRWDQRLTSLGETSNYLDFEDAALQAASYPETIALASVLASPYWVALAASRNTTHELWFYAEVAQRLDVSTCRPSSSYDPLHRWCRQEAGADYFTSLRSRMIIGDRPGDPDQLDEIPQIG
jgi:hypothetical protein